VLYLVKKAYFKALGPWSTVTKDELPLKEKNMIITNVENLPHKEILEHHGIVSGSTVRAKHAGRDFMAGLKNFFGGELKGYTELLAESRDEAINRMKAQAEEFGANAILNVRFSTSSVAAGAAELYVYGTAVTVR
jgi:uncharacterized protein YbjQ (UPF0145 family)